MFSFPVIDKEKSPLDPRISTIRWSNKESKYEKVKILISKVMTFEIKV